MSKFNPETISRYLDALRLGLTQRRAAVRAGVSEDTIIRWKQENADFAEQIRLADTDYELDLLRKAKKHHAVTLLKMRYPEEYFDLKHVETIVHEITAKVPEKSPEELKQELAFVARFHLLDIGKEGILRDFGPTFNQVGLEIRDVDRGSSTDTLTNVALIT